MNKNLLFLLILLLGWSCKTQTPDVILISKDWDGRIEKWLHKADSTLNIREFYTVPKDSMNYFLKASTGIVIGGGRDIHPSIYNKEEYVEVCGSFDLFRDSIEILMIGYALENKIPLLGICRGHQIMNAANGGTLIPDIPSFTDSDINHRSESDSAHFVICENNSWLHQLGLDTIWVNSHHHQCADKISPIFKVSASAPDDIIESIEILDQTIHPFAVGVQWHPEGLLDKASMKIADRFLQEIAK